jgi:hypothetical protein
MRDTLVSLIGVFAVVLPVWGQSLQPVATRAFDNSRSGANTSETILTRDNVLAKGIRRVTVIPVFGDARGTESQPLIVPGVKLKDGSTHDVMILPSMANIVRGVDAETGAALWQTNLGRPINGGAAIDMHQINDHWGVLSTGVVAPDTKRVYLVAWISPDGTPQMECSTYVCLTSRMGRWLCRRSRWRIPRAAHNALPAQCANSAVRW